MLGKVSFHHLNVFVTHMDDAHISMVGLGGAGQVAIGTVAGEETDGDGRGDTGVTAEELDGLTKGVMRAAVEGMPGLKDTGRLRIGGAD